MNGPLFRREALEAKRAGWLGAITLARPLGMRLLAWITVAVVASVVLFLVSADYTRRTRVAGTLAPIAGEAVVLAPATGVVAQLAVGQGERVKSGQSLGVLSVPRATREDGDTARALAQGIAQRRGLLQTQARAEREERERRGDGLRRQLEDARRERVQLEAEISTRREQVAIARDTLERMRQLRESGYVSELQARQQQTAMLDGMAAVQALGREQTQLSRSIAALEQELAALDPLDNAAAAESGRLLSELERERIEAAGEGEALIAAPVTGVVANLPVKSGQTVTVGQPLLTLLPGDGALEAELLVPSRAVGFVDPGDRVLLRYRAYPYQKFGHHRGRVRLVGRSALTGAELTGRAALTEEGESYYRVVVRLDRQSVRAYGREERLQPGMAVDAEILGERRRLIEWVFEPL